jgi:hypothetical protein
MASCCARFGLGREIEVRAGKEDCRGGDVQVRSELITGEEESGQQRSKRDAAKVGDTHTHTHTHTHTEIYTHPKFGIF